MSEEVDRVLAKAPILERALGRVCAVLVLIFALWIVRPKSGTATALAAVGAVVWGWFKLR
jgi:hypothetical protein